MQKVVQVLSQMADRIKTSAASRTCKCSEFPRAGVDSEEIANSEK